MTPFAVRILATLLQLAVPRVEPETAEHRLARMQPIAEAMADVSAEVRCVDQPETCRVQWPGPRRELAIAFIAIGYHESGFAPYVGEDRCHDGPKGARCDNGRALGYWQLHRNTCAAAWDSPHAPGSYARLVVELRCVVRAFSSAHRICNENAIDWAYVFGRYGGRQCAWVGGKTRAFTMLRVSKLYERMSRQPASALPTIEYPKIND
jgi:hypothetical protein